MSWTMLFAIPKKDLQKKIEYVKSLDGQKLLTSFAQEEEVEPCE